MGIYQFEGKKPSIGKGTYVHPDATIIGDVTIGEGCYIGPGACIRGDWGAIVIGSGSNIQENCVIHVFPGETALLGPRSHIGHGSILHTPTLGEHVLVGMGAIIMDWAEIGDGCCIGAGALVTEKTVIPPNKLVLGVPAKVVAEISDKMRQSLNDATAYYLALPPRCHRGMVEVTLEECQID
ncbi:gamma carbonic anhydrase family protein [Desulfoscipio gibsoniae]|uniref:Isoleucine patch superfamily enzyme, carbonic anhydrase/acetyltransferase n=1 Tax=Desulfoscipio gibsoniae DSM 7213 TaxID=767817 RepID=R4KKB4_9FIRM|nr:gamma carbonic anhydrase family protein [Desulfoscipio gibsoniae]AGL03089.1 isoleucine patch superfamily enzyme, carbonic anhydrase/acetyltransferase [Desulfoscipio gibsoniae DSM 7213]